MAIPTTMNGVGTNFTTSAPPTTLPAMCERLITRTARALLAGLELSPAQSTPEKLVDQPHAIGGGNIDLAIAADLANPPLLHIALDLSTVDVIRLARIPECPAEVVETGLPIRRKGGERIAEIESILGVAVEVWPER